MYVVDSPAGRGAEEVVKAHPELHVAQTISIGGATNYTIFILLHYLTIIIQHIYHCLYSILSADIKR